MKFLFGRAACASRGGPAPHFNDSSTSWCAADAFCPQRPAAAITCTFDAAPRMALPGPAACVFLNLRSALAVRHQEQTWLRLTVVRMDFLCLSAPKHRFDTDTATAEWKVQGRNCKGRLMHAVAGNEGDDTMTLGRESMIEAGAAGLVTCAEPRAAMTRPRSVPTNSFPRNPATRFILTHCSGNRVPSATSPSAV